MKSSFRPTSVDDLTPLCQFLARVFGIPETAPSLLPAVMSWKYWDERTDFAGPRSYILERDGAIVAHTGLWPMTFGSGENVVRGVHMIDWASAKESAGAGLALVQKLAGMFDFIVGIGGTDMTRKVLPAFGFQEHAQVWKGARPIRPVAQALTHQFRNLKLPPRLVRNTLRSMKGDTPYKIWSAREIQPQDIARDIATGPDTAHFAPRSPEFFEYFLRCPAAPAHLYGIFDGAEMKGHFIICVVRGQARVAGIWLREPSKESYGATYFLAASMARALPGANEIAAVGTKGLSGEGAERAGYEVKDGPWVYLLDKKKKLSLPADFQFQPSDDDEAFLDYGVANYWT